MTQWVLSQQITLSQLLEPVLGKFHLTQESEQVETLSVLDDFENHIIRSDAMLVQRGQQYRLYLPEKNSPDDAEPLEHKQRARLEFAADLPESGFRQELKALIGFRKLEAVCQFELQRQEWVLRNRDDKAVVKLEWLQTGNSQAVEHAGDPESDNASEIHQVLITRAIRGYDKPFRKVEKHLTASGASLCEGSVAHVLLALSGYRPTDYTLKPDIPLNETMTAREAVSLICLTTLKTARRNESGMMNTIEDTEYLHDFRVCLRKVRSLVSLLKGVFPEADFLQLKEQLAEFARQTNDLRDLDVYLLKQDNYLNRLPPHLRPGLPAMFQDFSRRRTRARKELKDWLGQAAFQRRMEQVMQRFETLHELPETDLSSTNIRDLIFKKARRRFEKIGTMGLAITPETPDEDVHELRIQCKKLRYLLDMFAPLFDAEHLSLFTGRLRKLQNTLGKFNDYSVQQASLLSYLESGKREKTLATSLGALILMLSQSQQAEREKVESRFADFYGEETRQLADQLFNEESVS